jgi:TrpR-related protein YerC/YecD
MSTANNSGGEHLALYQAILSLRNEMEAAKFFEDLCTPVELQDMSDRWKVVQPLKENMPYRKIQELTGVSVTTVGRVARVLKYGTGGYDLILTRMSKKHGQKKANFE